MLSILFALACSSDIPAPVVTAAVPASTATAAPAPAAPAAPASAWKPTELPACHELSLLVKYDYAYIQQHYCELCKDVDDQACVLDWPSSDVPSCSYFDQLRNGIYAYYGYNFQKAEWKDYFTTQPWYSADPAFDAARMSAQANRNIALLKTMVEKKQGCL